MNPTQTSTPRKLYAFLVGINDYPEGVSSLNGCVQDIEAFQEYLNLRVAPHSGFELQPPHILRNEQATRQAVIDGFTQYLAQAQSNDVALFYYAGHGSQQETPEELAQYEPDGLNETLVCWDSRLEGNWDLADRELAFLISKLAENQPHFVAILDCCHSGHGLRGNTVRKVDTDRRKRPFSSFLFSLADYAPITRSRNLHENPSHWSFPNSRHILLAACRDRELAQEVYFTDPTSEQTIPRGVFSYFLQETLKKSKGSPTYRDLFNETKALVVSQVSQQAPQLEAVQENINQPFLGGAIAPCPAYYTVRFDPDHQWVIDGGAIHGIPQPQNGEKVLLALFPREFDFAQSSTLNLETAIGTVEVSQVFSNLSRLKIPESIQLDSEITYKALVASLPLPPLAVSYTGDRQHLEPIRQAIQQANPFRQPSLYVRLAEPFDKPELHLIAQDNQFAIYRAGQFSDDRTSDRTQKIRPLSKPVPFSDTSAIEVVRQLEHIARWTAIARLNNTAHSQIDNNAVHIRFFEGEGEQQTCKEITDSSLRLTYPKENQEPIFRISLTNSSPIKLYCAILCLSDDFSITSKIIGQCVELQPSQTVWARDGAPFYGIVPKPLWEQGITEITDIMVIIASRQPFDATLLEQEGLEIIPSHVNFDTPRSATCGHGTLNRLMKRAITRIVSDAPERSESCDDWIAKRVSLTFIRPPRKTAEI